jgi:hypothetical protein
MFMFFEGLAAPITCPNRLPYSSSFIFILPAYKSNSVLVLGTHAAVGELGSVWERGSTRIPKKFKFFFFAKI